MQSQKLDIAERAYADATEKYLRAKDKYEWVKAKSRELLRVNLKDKKTTLLEIEDKIRREENETDGELKTEYLAYVEARTDKEIKKVESDSEGRKYWDNKGLLTEGS